MSIVIPMHGPACNIQSTIQTAKEQQNKTIRTSVTSHAKYLDLLQKLCRGNKEYLHAHLSYGFLVLTEQTTLFELTSNPGLSFTRVPTVTDKSAVLITATLDTWIKTIVSCATESATTDMREIVGGFYTFFVKLGYSSAFEKYHKRKGRDGTLIMVAK